MTVLVRAQMAAVSCEYGWRATMAETLDQRWLYKTFVQTAMGAGFALAGAAIALWLGPRM
jgi:hypothetical protein